VVPGCPQRANREETAINNNNDLFINEQIRDREVRVIGEDGEQLGVMPTSEALKLAQEAELDLVKIAPTANPPVCRIVDYGKYKYDQLRKAKEAKKKQKIVDVKEIRMSPNIDTNDLNTKINAARKFLIKGNRVKFTIRFRGREMAHMGASVHILTDIAEQLKDVAVMEKEPRTEGRFMNMIMAFNAAAYKGGKTHAEKNEDEQSRSQEVQGDGDRQTDA
jgi:translation initiation factor IF-3